MGLKKLKELFEQGKYNELLDHLEELDPQTILEGEVFKIIILLYNNQLEDASKLADRIIDKAQEKDQKILEIRALLSKCFVLRSKYNRIFSSSNQEATSLQVHWLQILTRAENLFKNANNSSLDSLGILQAELLHHEGMYYRSTKEYEKAFTKLEKSKDICEKHQYLYQLANVNQEIGWIYQNVNDIESALQHFQNAYTVFQQLGNNQEIMYICQNLSTSHFYLNEYELAIEYLRQGLEIATQLVNRISQSYFHIWLGWVNFVTNKFDLAIKEFFKAKSVAEEINYKNYVAWSLSGIGAAYLRKGEFDNALKILQNALNFNWNRWWVEMFIGEVYWGKNLLKKALEYLQSSLTGIQDLYPFREETCWIFFDIITVNLELKQFEKAKEFLNSFQQLIEENSSNRTMDTFFQLAKGRLLKESPRLTNKMEAMKIFEKVSLKKEIQITHRTYALLNLCDLLLLEFRSLGDETILSDIQDKISQIIEIANKSHSYVTMVEMLLMKSKLALIRGNFPETQHLLTEAKLFAQNYQLGNLITKVQQEDDEFKNEFQKWSDLVNKNTSITEMMERTKIQNYINEALSTKEKTLKEITNF